MSESGVSDNTKHHAMVTARVPHWLYQSLMNESVIRGSSIATVVRDRLTIAASQTLAAANDVKKEVA